MNQSINWSPFRAYRKQKIKFLAWQDILFLTLIIFCIVFLYARISKLPGYDWNWDLLTQFIIHQNKSGNYQPGIMLQGLCTTLRIGIWTIIFSFISGGLLGILCAKTSFGITIFFQAYINIIRNTPPLVILFCVYFFAGNILPLNHLQDFIRDLPHFWQEFITIIFARPGQIDRMIAAILALSLYQGAYVAEIIRSGVESVPSNQWDAAAALGFSRWQTVWLIILPQATKIILPPLTGQAITTFKDSALASLISLPDLTFQSLEIMAVSNMTFEIWMTCAFLYFIIGIICSWAGKKLEKHYSSFTL